MPARHSLAHTILTYYVHFLCASCLSIRRLTMHCYLTKYVFVAININNDDDGGNTTFTEKARDRR
jgi:hypothetical protein